ncbi:MAG: carboxypeptidase regulatory-like domain-containing protein [Muribaculaceae bacterium]|nr:carboxypeptidase regulatory-like domain-containing protein [Muribaculaceae bacterium]
MRIRLTLLVLLCALLPSLALAQTGIKGTVVDAQTGRPVADANLLLADQAIFVVSGPDGSFTISNAAPGSDVLEIIASGFEDAFVDIKLTDGLMNNLGEIKLNPSGFEAGALNSDNFLFNEEEILEDEGIGQSIGTIQGATDDVYYSTANYNFSIVRFRNRGYNQTWQTGYVNGFNLNDAMRGQFNFSMFGGMTSSAFRNRSTEIGQAPAAFGYGSIGGSTSVTTYASEYAPGWKGSLAYTNSNYMLRAMLQYATGLNKHGWAFTASIIGRYAPEGVIEGTFYNSFGYFLGLQKVFNDKHSLNLSTWGAPTQRATNSAATQEAYDLAGSNLYNPSWGYLDGKKKSSKIVESFDPSVMLNWIWKPKFGTRLNTGLAFRSNNYSSSALNWYQSADPRPDYYRNLPSYFRPTADPELDPELYAAQLAQQEYVADYWGGAKSHRQIDWNSLYQANRLNCLQYDRDPDLKGQSSYILENRHSNFNAYMLQSTLDHRFSDILTLQGGVNATFTDARYYKTVRDLLGGEFWRDVDNFSERDFAGDVNIMQNDLDNPNRRVGKGDKFGYDYYIRNWNAGVWLQNQITTTYWNVNYAAEFSWTDFWRHGNMRNGRAPGDENGLDHNGNPAAVQSLGKGKEHSFFNWGVKAGATYKIDGRNYITAHAGYGTRAPLPNDAYISPRTKDTAVPELKSERYLSADLSYTWNYPRFRGSITGFYTQMWDGMKRSGFYDYELSSFMNYAMSGVETLYQGIELGMQYKILSNLSATFAGTLAKYQYNNNPLGTRSYENGSKEDVTRRVYLKHYHVGGTPETAMSIGLNYNIKQWFFEVNAQWFGDAYYDISPSRHEEMPGLWKLCVPTADKTAEEIYREKRDEIAYQDHLNSEWVMNLSIGKIIYTKFGSVNINLSVNNLLNNRNIQTNGYQEGKFDYTNYDVNKFPNKVWYAQGTRVFLNLGIKF